MKWLGNAGWVALVTATLGYAAAALAAERIDATSSEYKSHHIKSLEDKGRSTLSERWKEAKLQASLPGGFAHTAPNILEGADRLGRAFDVLTRSGRALKVVQLGDSHVAAGTYPAAVRTTLEKAWGSAAGDSISAPLRFNYLARNGATAEGFITPERAEQIAEMAPDLIIVSFGTNECHGMGYNPQAHRRQLEIVYDRLTRACPEAVIMLTTPPGDYLSRTTTQPVRRGARTQRRRVSVRGANPMTAKCAEVIRTFGREKGLAVWDLNAIAGGDSSASNWVAARLMRPDRIHFTPEGYRLHGCLLGEAILSAYNSYLTAATAQN